MSYFESNLEMLLEPLIESILEDDDYYRHLETPLKKAGTIKNDQRYQLNEIFKMNGIRSRLLNAQNLISNFLPEFVSQEILGKIMSEMDKSSDHLMAYIESANQAEEKFVSFQDIFGWSDETLLHLYDFASHLIRTGKIAEANDLFLFLTTLSPQIASYWIGQGVCLQALKQYEEALAVYDAAKFLNNSDPLPYAYSMEIYQILKKTDKENAEALALRTVVNSLGGDELALWNNRKLKL